MTVQELIDILSEYDPYLEVGILDPNMSELGEQIECVYEDTIDADTEDEHNVIYIQGGQLL